MVLNEGYKANSVEFDGLTGVALDFYQTHGFVVLSSVFSNVDNCRRSILCALVRNDPVPNRSVGIQPS